MTLEPPGADGSSGATAGTGGGVVQGDTPPHGVPAVVVGGGSGRGGLGGDDRAGGTEGRAGPDASRIAADRVPPGARARASAGGGGHHRARRRRRTRRARWLIAALAVVAVVAGLAGWYESEAHPFGSPGRAVEVDVRPGESTDSIFAALTRDGVIGSSLAFRLWSVVHGEPTVRPGRYLLHRNLAFSTVSADLNAGPNVYEVVVAPGETVSEIAQGLSSLPGALAKPFLSDARRGTVRSPFQSSGGGSLEGLIGAGVYQLLPGETASQLLGKMASRFDSQAKAAGLTPSSVVGGLTAYQVVTIASISQKEGYFDRYFGDVSRVIYNRLADGMSLDMTSTVLYSLGLDGGQVTPAEEQQTTPYNTYLHAGLTPTPICVPSERALAAAVSPPSGNWLYFDLVTAKKGVMVFSSTYAGQVAAEQQAAANSHASS